MTASGADTISPCPQSGSGSPSVIRPRAINLNLCKLGLDVGSFDGSFSQNDTYQLASGQTNYAPVAGFSDQTATGVVGFATKVTDPPQVVSFDGATEKFGPYCVSGCADLVVQVTRPSGDPTQPGTPLPGATVTGTLGSPVFSAPEGIEPPAAGDGQVCDATVTTACAQTATTNANGDRSSGTSCQK